MIVNFEEITKDLSPIEKLYVMPRVWGILTLAIGKDNSITNKYIVDNINKWNPITYVLTDDPQQKEQRVKTDASRIRKVIHCLRVSNEIPCLIATSLGYYVSHDKKEVETYIQSIDERLRSIYQVRRTMKRQLRDWVMADAVQQELNLIEHD